MPKKIIAGVGLLIAIGVILTVVTYAPHQKHVVENSAVMYHCPMHPAYTSDNPGTCPICGMNLVKIDKVQIPDAPASVPAVMPTGAPEMETIYQCPMHPDVTSNAPGKCPICGMHLVKTEKAAVPPAQATQSVAPVQAQEKTLEEVCLEHRCTMQGADCPMKVTTHLAPGERLICPCCGEVIGTTSGNVVEIAPSTAAPSTPAAQIVTIAPEQQQLLGIATAVATVRDLTKQVRASGKIAYDPALAVTQEEFVQALQAEDSVKYSPLADVIARAGDITNAARAKLRLLGMSDEQIGQLEKTRQVETNLYLPGRGDTVWAYLAVYEYEIGVIAVGAQVTIEAVAYPGETFPGVVRAINPVLDPATRTNQVRVEVTNRDDKLKPEMFVTGVVDVVLGNKLAVPKSAVLDTGVRKIVYVATGANAIESREVMLGQDAGDYYEVTGGLVAGESVIVSGNFLVDSEAKLKA